MSLIPRPQKVRSFYENKEFARRILARLGECETLDDEGIFPVMRLRMCDVIPFGIMKQMIVVRTSKDGSQAARIRNALFTPNACLLALQPWLKFSSESRMLTELGIHVRLGTVWRTIPFRG